MLQHRLATPVIQPRMHFFDREGKPLIGGKVYSFKVGEDIFKPTYRNSEFTAANQNPILLDQAGSALIYVRGSVQLKIYDKSGVFIEEKIVYQQQMRTQFFDKYGKALGGGKVWTYDYQSTIKKPSYENADDALLNPNPVILDENGCGSVSIVGAYRLRQYDKKGVFVGDQDFKRPPIKVLTSVVYPLYFLDQMSLDFAINEAVQKQLVNETEKVERIETVFAIAGAQITSEVRYINANINDSVELNFAIAGAQITAENKPPTYITANLVDSIGISFAIAGAQITSEARYITTNIDIERIETTFAIAGAQITN